MTEDQRIGTVYWIDHYGVPITDRDRWTAFYEEVLGASEAIDVGGGEANRSRTAAFMRTCRSHAGGFVQAAALPPAKGLGRGLPRYGYFIRQDDIPAHVRRLEKFRVPHTEPARTSAEGEAGIVIYFEDPDQNQLEFWAPDHLPDGAMEGVGPLGVGKICSAVFESRDLDRTTDFCTRFLAVDQIVGSSIPSDTVCFGLAGGGRIVFKKVDRLEGRTGCHPELHGPHTAPVIREDEVLVAYRRLWAGLPEPDPSEIAEMPPTELPARTKAAGNLKGGKLTDRTFEPFWPRSDSFVDWDANLFHLVGGVPVGGRMTNYGPVYMEDRVVAHEQMRGMQDPGAA